MSATDLIPPAPRARFLSLDVFRGMSVFAMILVNTGGAGAPAYAELRHTPWLGFSIADLVFPSFLFAVGNALSFVGGERGEHRVFMARLLKRSLLIFLLGMLLYQFPFFHQTVDGSWHWNPWSEARIPGVLQRIALVYAAAALLSRYLSLSWLWLISLALLLGYWAALYLGSPAGNALDKMHNLVTRVDLAVFGPQHLYRKDGGFDPEGLLSSLPAIVNVLAGYIAGRFILQWGKSWHVVLRLARAGLVLLLLALAWAPWFPLAKKLWTSSFVLYTVGWDLLILAVLMQWFEVSGHTLGAHFFTVFGKNALVIYLLSELLSVVLDMIHVAPGLSLLNWFGLDVFQHIVAGPFGSLLAALSYTMLCWLVAWWMDRRKIYVKL